MWSRGAAALWVRRARAASRCCWWRTLRIRPSWGRAWIDARGGAKLLQQTETWWELAHRAKVEDQAQAVPRLLVVRRSNDFTLFQITLRNSPNCHVTTEAVDGFTAWGVKLDTPKWARNTDGIDPQTGTTNVSIVDSYLRTGDDNISPKSTAAGAVTRAALSHMTVRNVHFYNGHGFGIGSQLTGGISAVRVDGLTIDGADNGIRIKSDRSRGGLVEDVRFENVCMRGVPNPIVMTPMYTTFEGTRLPVYRGIVLRNVRSLSGGPVTLVGLDAQHRLEATLDNVVVDGIKPADVTARHAVLTMRRSNLEPAGDDVRVVNSAAAAVPASAAAVCDASRFVPFPEENVTPALGRAGAAGGQGFLCGCGWHGRLLLGAGRAEPGACHGWCSAGRAGRVSRASRGAAGACDAAQREPGRAAHGDRKRYGARDWRGTGHRDGAR